MTEDKGENDDSDDQCCTRNDYLGFLLHLIPIHRLEECKYAPLHDSSPHLPPEPSEASEMVDRAGISDRNSDWLEVKIARNRATHPRGLLEK
jgi:hypothetical protein